MTEEIDTFNKFAVASSGTRIRILRPPWEGSDLSPDDALLLAAYLVALAEHDATHKFAEVLKAVEST
jgi:hypothetical protein